MPPLATRLGGAHGLAKPPCALGGVGALATTPARASYEAWMPVADIGQIGFVSRAQGKTVAAEDGSGARQMT